MDADPSLSLEKFVYNGDCAVVMCARKREDEYVGAEFGFSSSFGRLSFSPPTPRILDNLHVSRYLWAKKKVKLLDHAEDFCPPHPEN